MGDDGLDPEQRLQRMARQLHEAIDEPPRRDGGGQPMTKEQVREIIEAIKAIPIVDVTETNRRNFNEYPSII